MEAGKGGYPLILKDKVVFRVEAPSAGRVEINGSWDDSPYTDMQRGGDGAWYYEIPLPRPDIYSYNISIDYHEGIDQENPFTQRDLGKQMSAFIVEGDESRDYLDAPEGERGTLRYEWYDSPTLGLRRRMAVYLPHGYQRHFLRKYPVLYLLHGAGGDEEAWSCLGRVPQIMDNLISSKRAVPMIVAMPNGNIGQMASPYLGCQLPTP